MKPILKHVCFEKEFTPVPHLYDFGAILAPLNEKPIEDLMYLSGHTPISAAIKDTLGKDPVYLVDENPEHLIERFIRVLTQKQEVIVADGLKQHPYPSDFQMLPSDLKKQWKQWINQVPVTGFNSGKYETNMVKEIVKEISYNKEGECNEDVIVAKKENDYSFLITLKFKFLYIKRYIGLGLIYDTWYKSMGFRMQKLMFPYEWLESYEKLSHGGPVDFEHIHSSLKPTIAKDEYEFENIITSIHFHNKKNNQKLEQSGK